MRRKIILLLMLLMWPAHGSLAQGTGLRKATLIPQWVPQAQFAGYYVAREKGLFRKRGIDFLKQGLADFATLWLSSGIAMRAEGIKVLNIGQIVQQSALMLVAKKSRGIHSPRDMQNRKVGLWGPLFQVQPHAFFRKYRITVLEVPQAYSVNLFLWDGVDVVSAMWYNEYHTIVNAGINPEELSTFFFHEHGLNFPEDGIYALEKTWRESPDLCRDFVEASIEGWQYAFDHPDDAVEVIMGELKKEHIPANRIHQKWMLARMKDLILNASGPTAMGQLLEDDYERVGEGLKESGIIETIPSFSDFHRSYDAALRK
jgi:NitT/TauT family transport system substrate-binding protein